MAAITHNNSTPTLEARIAVALSDNTPQARTLANLIAETETAIVEAEAQSATQQQRALDPILSPDPIKARELLEFAAFAAKRLRTVLPRLVGLHATIIAKERAQRWTAAADAIQTRRDALVQDFAETYPALVSQLVDLFERTRAMDAEVERINGSAPNSESRRIAGIAATHILANTKLLDLTNKQLWPPPTPPILPHEVMPIPSHPGADWWRANQERDAERHRASQRVADFYANQARQREEREAAEAKAARLRRGTP